MPLSTHSLSCSIHPLHPSPSFPLLPPLTRTPCSSAARGRADLRPRAAAEPGRRSPRPPPDAAAAPMPGHRVERRKNERIEGRGTQVGQTDGRRESSMTLHDGRKTTVGGVVTDLVEMPHRIGLLSFLKNLRRAADLFNTCLLFPPDLL